MSKDSDNDVFLLAKEESTGSRPRHHRIISGLSPPRLTSQEHNAMVDRLHNAGQSSSKQP